MPPGDVFFKDSERYIVMLIIIIVIIIILKRWNFYWALKHTLNIQHPKTMP